MRQWMQTEKKSDRRVRIAFQKHNILDCNNVVIPCVTDAQCRNNCIDGMIMYCDDGGFCSKTSRIDNMENCDEDKGLIVVLNALDGLVVERMCVSLYRDVINDDGSLKPYVCENGEMILNLTENLFDTNDCTCLSNYQKFVFKSSAFTRPIPVCIPHSLSVLYGRIYEKSHIIEPKL